MDEDQFKKLIGLIPNVKLDDWEYNRLKEIIAQYDKTGNISPKERDFLLELEKKYGDKLKD